MLCTCFESFGAADIETYDRYFRESAAEISDSFPNSRVAWNSGFHYQKALIGDLFCLISDGGPFTTPHLAMPVGRLTAASLQQAIDEIAPHFECQGWPFRVLYVDERSLPLLRDLQGYKVRLSRDERFSDYVYEAESLVTLAGKACTPSAIMSTGSSGTVRNTATPP